MSINLIHRNYSGFFPFNIANETDLASVSSTPIRNVAGFSINSLVKAFWLAKSVSVTASISATMDQHFGGGSGTHVVTTSSINQPAIAVPLASISTQGRTVNPPLSFPAASDSSQIIPWPYTWASNFINPPNPDSPTSGSGNLNLQLSRLLNWFSYLRYSDQSYASKDSDGNYLTAAAISLPAPAAQGPSENQVDFLSQPTTVPNPYPAVPGIICNIKIDGVTIPSPIPLFYAIEANTVLSFSATGNVLFDFDTFNDS